MLPTLTRAARRAVKLRRRLHGPVRPSWSEGYEAFALVLHQYAVRSAMLPMGLQRLAVERAMPLQGPSPAHTETLSLDGMPAEWLQPPGSRADAVIYYLHGGGYALGSIATHRHFIDGLARATGCAGFIIDYRLAPQHRYPAQLDDAIRGYLYLLQRGVAPERIVVAGESAGGGLTMSLQLALKQRGLPLPAGAACISPWLDLESSSGSTSDNADADYLSRALLLRFARLFAARSAWRDPLAAPLYGDYRGLGPLLLQAGGAEVLVDDSRRAAARAQQAGVDCTLAVHDDMVHAWTMFVDLLPEARPAFLELTDFLRGTLERR
jgi:acetyl esterase/lipase